MKHKTLFGKIWGAIADIFTNAAKELWNDLSEAEQDALKAGSGAISIINEHLDEAPALVLIEINKKFPTVDFAAILNLCEQFNLFPYESTVESAVSALQAYLKSKQGTVWENASSILAQTLSIILSKDGRPGKVATLMEYVYQTFVKGGTRPPNPH